MLDNKFILSEIKKTLRKSAGTNVIDLDKEFNHEFDFFCRIIFRINLLRIKKYYRHQ